MKLNHSVSICKMKLSASGFINYTYLLIEKETQSCFLIDPAWDYHTIMNTINHNLVDLKGILLTHSHYDHTNLVNRFILNFPSTPVYMSKVEADFYNFQCKNLNVLKNDEVLLLGNTKLSCILTPGHTKGSMCYLIDQHLFTGDTVFSEGCGFCTGNGGSASEMYDTMQMIKQLPGHITIWPGHSFGIIPGKRMDELFDNNIYFHFKDRKSFVDFRNRKNQTNLLSFK